MGKPKRVRGPAHVPARAEPPPPANVLTFSPSPLTRVDDTPPEDSPFQLGVGVRVHSLQKAPELNGAQGEVIGYAHSTGRVSAYATPLLSKSLRTNLARKNLSTKVLASFACALSRASLLCSCCS
jgi:hypothetical protein